MAFSAGFPEGSSRVKQAWLRGLSRHDRTAALPPGAAQRRRAGPAGAYSAVPWLTLSSAWTC